MFQSSLYFGLLDSSFVRRQVDKVDELGEVSFPQYYSCCGSPSRLVLVDQMFTIHLDKEIGLGQLIQLIPCTPDIRAEDIISLHVALGSILFKVPMAYSQHLFVLAIKSTSCPLNEPKSQSLIFPLPEEYWRFDICDNFSSFF